RHTMLQGDWSSDVCSSDLLIAGLLVFALINERVVVLGAIVAVLGFFYSHPKLNFKGTPIASSLPHLIGGIFHFLLGYSVFTEIEIGRASCRESVESYYHAK